MELLVVVPEDAVRVGVRVGAFVYQNGVLHDLQGVVMEGGER